MSLEAYPLAAHHSVASLRAHPQFLDAVDRLTDGLIVMYGDDLKLVRSLFEFDHALTFMIAVSIHFSADPNNPDTWLTLPLLQASVARVGIDAPRRVRRLTEEMRADGLLSAEALPSDRRAYRLYPTELMLQLDREWLMTFHAPLALLFPAEPRYARAMGMEPAYQAAYRKPSLRVLEIADGIIHRNLAFEFFFGQSAGIRILALLMAAVRGHSRSRTPPGFYSHAAERSGTSRAHIRNVMRAAQHEDLVSIDPARGRAVTVLPALVEGYQRWVAESLSSTDWVSAVGCDADPIAPLWAP